MDSRLDRRAAGAASPWPATSPSEEIAPARRRLRPRRSGSRRRSSSRRPALGLAGGIVPAEYGGAGLDHVTYARLIEEISRACHIVACALTFPSGLVGNSILRLRDRGAEAALPGAARARRDLRAAPASPRPARAPTSPTWTRPPRRDGSDCVINGAKMWISFLDVATYYLTFAHLGVDEATGRKQICAFLDRRRPPGRLTPPAQEQVRLPPARDGRAGARGRARPRRRAARRGGPRVRSRDERGRERPPRRRRARGRASPRPAVDVGRSPTRSERRRLQAADRAVPDGAGDAQRHDLRHRGRAAPDPASSRTSRTAASAPAAPPRWRRCTASDVALQVAPRTPSRSTAPTASPTSTRSARYLRDAKVFQIVEGNNQLHKALVAESVLGVR